MPERTFPPDVLDLAGLLVEEWSQQLAGTLGELAQVLREPSPTRPAPSDHWAPLIVGIRAGGRADRILGQQLDRARVTIYNTGAVTVAIGNNESVRTDTSNRFDIEPGAALTLDTRAEIFAVAATEGELTLLVEEWDL